MKRRKTRPLLVAGFGIALISIPASGCFTSGNLMVQRCSDGGFPLFENPADECAKAVDAGKPDGGTDGGSDGGP